MKTIKILIIVLNLFIGYFMVTGGLDKFGGETPSPDKIIEQVKKGEEVAPSNEILMIINYVFGMKQTGYFWTLLGITEILAGILMLSQIGARIGAVIALPLTLNIWLFHLFLEPNEIGELVLTTALFVGNIILIATTYKIWKPLLFDRNAFKLRAS